jgi:hypothetical protein
MVQRTTESALPVSPPESTSVFRSPFAKEVDPSTAAALSRWRHDPGLTTLLSSLEAQDERRTFLDRWAEAMVALHLQQMGCEVASEIPTPGGRTADLRVRRSGEELYLHIKRLDTDVIQRESITISPRLRVLERIQRSLVVRLRWDQSLNEAGMQRYVEGAARFIRTAHVGDETILRSESGDELGGLRVVAPWEGPGILLAIGLPKGFIDEVPHVRKLMERAYEQFMPRATNIIVIATDAADVAEEVDTALLGSHIERWDRHPPHGRRIAHGRATDGFWLERSRPESLASAWVRCPLSGGFQSRLWLRPAAALAAQLQFELVDLLEVHPEI